MLSFVKTTKNDVNKIGMMKQLPPHQFTKFNRFPLFFLFRSIFRLEVGRLRMLVRTLTQFVTIRQFPPADRSLPPLSKSKWWIPAAARVLALLSEKTFQIFFLFHNKFVHKAYVR